MSKVKSFLIIFLGTIIVLVGVYYVWRYASIKEMQRGESQTIKMQNIQPIEAIVTNLEINEAAGIEPDVQLLEKLEKSALEIWKASEEYNVYHLTDIMRMIHVYTYLDMEYAEEVKKYIFDYYNEDMDGFFGSVVAPQMEFDEFNKIRCAEQTIGNGEYIIDYVPKEKYDVIAKAVEWYDKYIDLASDSEDAMDVAGSCFWFLYEEGEIDRIDYMKMLPYMEEYIEDNIKTIKAGEITMNTVVSASMCVEEQEIFGLETTYKGVDQQIYEQLDSMEAFECTGKDELELMLLNSNLLEVDDVSKNSYYVENINSWLMEYYNNCVQ